MPFRARMKRAFTRSSSNSSNSTDSLSKSESRGVGDPNIYQPGEQMPRSKYRAPVDKKHKAMLDSFSFGSKDARRRSTSSQGSLYSPMGSRMPSRNNSILRPTWAKQERSCRIGVVAEGADDGTDVGNVGGASKRPSKDGRRSQLHTRGNSVAKSNGVQHLEVVPPAPSSGNAYDHTPFSVAELSSALDRSTSKPPMQTL